ncbi:MAG: succinyl-diaminopimelate desuccinylase [Myxococcales bacterium]|nr:succinyl-diaminopimelate desuccinylase [Myxococcales bacterium]
MFETSEAALKSRLAQLTCSLCDIPSVTGDERALCDHLEAWARARFSDGEIRRVGNSLVLGTLDDPRPLVALVGHLDTVPGAATDFPARIVGERVVGLGSSDMKSGDAVMMALAEDLDRATLDLNPVLVFYEREEGPFDENGLGPLLDHVPALTRARLAIVLESSDSELQMACQGSLHARLVFDGKRGHSARPWHGDNAIYRALPLLTELAALEPKPVEIDGFTFYEVLSATLASGGSARNVIPERFELNLNFRFSPGRRVEEAMAEVERFVAGRARIEWIDRSPAGKVCAQNPLYQRLARVSGARQTPKQAWTDVARLAQVGIDAINYGPGLTSQAHQADEWVPIDAIARCYQALRAFFEERDRWS